MVVLPLPLSPTTAMIVGRLGVDAEGEVLEGGRGRFAEQAAAVDL